MRNLLNNQLSLRTDSDIELEESVGSDLGRAQEIIRYIRPEQPLNVGEIVHIIEYDQLRKEEETSTGGGGGGSEEEEEEVNNEEDTASR